MILIKETFTLFYYPFLAEPIVLVFFAFMVSSFLLEFVEKVPSLMVGLLKVSMWHFKPL